MLQCTGIEWRDALSHARPSLCARTEGGAHGSATTRPQRADEHARREPRFPARRGEGAHNGAKIRTTRKRRTGARRALGVKEAVADEAGRRQEHKASYCAGVP